MYGKISTFFIIEFKDFLQMSFRFTQKIVFIIKYIIYKTHKNHIIPYGYLQYSTAIHNSAPSGVCKGLVNRNAGNTSTIYERACGRQNIRVVLGQNVENS